MPPLGVPNRWHERNCEGREEKKLHYFLQKQQEFEVGYLLQTLGHATVNFTVGKDLWVPFRAFVHLIIQQQQQQFQGISEVHGLWPKGIKILNLVL